MPTVSATFTELYAPGLRKVIFESYTYRPEEYAAFNNVGSSGRQFEEDYQMAGFGAVPDKLEGTAIVYDDPVPDSKITWTWTPKGKGFRATHEAMVDDLYGPMRRMAQSLGKAFRNQTEIVGALPLNNAFTISSSITNQAASGYQAAESMIESSGTVGGGTGHALLRGGVYSNAPNAAVDIGVTALQDALVNFEQLVDESNVPIVVTPAMLVVGPTNRPIAQEILGSSFKPFTADNEINILKSAGLKLMVSHYLTDADAWYVMANKSDHDVWTIWREKFTTDASDDFDTGDGKIKGYMRLGSGYGGWRGTYGAPGV